MTGRSLVARWKLLNPARGYGLAIVATGASALLRALLPQALSPAPYLGFYLAVVVSAALGGVGPGLVATFASLLLVNFAFGSFNVHDYGAVMRQVIWVVAGIGVSLLAGGLRAALRSAEEEAGKARAAEQAGSENEERIKLLGDNLPDSAVYQYLHEANGTVRFTYMSAGIERLRGVSAAQVLLDPETLRRQILPEHIQRLAEEEERSKRKLSDLDVEVPIRRADGEVRWMRQTSRPRRMLDGRTIWDGVQTDITERKLAEQKLTYLASFPEHNPNPVMEVDLEGTVRYANPAARSQFPDLEAKGLMHPWLAGLRALTEQFREGGTKAAKRDISIGDRHYHQTLHYFVQEGFLRVYGLDITERKRAEEALRESESRYRRLLQFLPIPVGVVSRNGQSLYFNDHFTQTFGYTQADLPTLETWWQRACPDSVYRCQVIENWEEKLRATQTGRETQPEELNITCKDGSVRVAVVSNLSLNDCILASFVDVTQRKQKEQELHKLNRSLRALSRSNQALARAQEQSQYLHEVCRIFVEDCGYKMVWVGFAEQDEAKTVRPVAHAGFEQGYLDTLKITWADTDRGRGPTGTAIRTGKPSGCSNMLSDSRFAPWRQEALERGYAASMVIPLLKDGTAFGAITIYSKDPDPFSESEVELLAELAADVVNGIEIIRARASEQQALEALRTSEARLRSILDQAPCGITIRDVPSGKLLLCNQQAGDLLYKPVASLDEVVDYQGTLRDGTPLARHDYALVRAAEHGETVSNQEFTFRRADGQALTLNVSASPIRGTNGQIIAAVALFYDITERKRAEVRLRRFFETDLYAVLYWKIDGGVVDVNDQFLKMTGYTREDLGAGLINWSKITPPEFHESDEDARRQVRETGVHRTYEKQYIRKDGSRVWGLFSAAAYEDDRTRGVSVILDITKRKQAEELLQSQARHLEALVQERTASLHAAIGELEHFSYTITHDMRAPLRAMRGYGDLLLKEAGELRPAARGYVERIRAAAARMDKLITDALDYSKVARNDFDLGPINPEPMLRSIIECYPGLQPSQAEILIDKLPLVIGNEACLTQCFSNLLSNAVKFVKPGTKPQVRIRAEERDERVRIYVEDNGIGIPPQYLEKVFGMFQRLSTDCEGTGIGLALVKKAAERMGGMAGVESEMGRGSQFWIELRPG